MEIKAGVMLNFSPKIRLLVMRIKKHVVIFLLIKIISRILKANLSWSRT